MFRVFPESIEDSIETIGSKKGKNCWIGCPYNCWIFSSLIVGLDFLEILASVS
jgi:hypothetical protein